MNRQERRSRGKLVDIRKLHPVWVRAVAGLAAVVMFCTVYALILPAAAITGSEATEEIGFYREETGEPDTATAASAEGMELAAAGEKDSAEESLETAESANVIQESQTQEETSGQAAQASETDVQTPETEEQAPKAEDQSLITEDQTHIAEGQTTKAEGQTSEAADQTTKSTEETTEQTSEPTSDETSEQPSDQTSEQSADQSAEQESSEEETSEDEEAEAVFKEGELTYQGGDYTVTLTYGEDAKIPEKAFLKVEELTEGDAYENCLKEAAETVEKKEQELHARLFDITICAENEDGEDEEIQPAGAVRVNIAYDEAVKLPEDAEMQVVHLAADKSEEENSVLDVETESKGTEVEGVAFDAEHFSVFVVMYTVDFEYFVNGKMYQFSLPGGGFVSFTDLVEVLGIIGGTNSEENSAAIDAATQAVDGTLDVTVSEAAKEFVTDVTSVEFSSPKLVDVSKVENQTTVGQIKERRGLKCEYSAGLTEEHIAEINAQTVKAGDWALISMQPFVSEETLTVTMKDGEVFTIHVTDAQIKKTVIDARGDTWEITVTYGEDAQIPDGAELKVREILPEDEKYEEYYEQSLDTTGVINANPEGEYAHVFDIQIWADEHEVEPASAVAVDIKLLDTPEEEEMDLKVVHFGKDGPEMMDTGSGEETEAGKAELSFVTEEFSVYTVVNVNNSTDIVGGGPWVLVSGIANDPGATTGYNETWGRDYFTIIVNANAMSDEAVTSQGNNVAFAAEGVHVWTNGSQSYVGGDVPQVWYFERVPNNNNRYYIYVLRNGQKYYIDHHYNNRATTSLSTQYKTEFTVERNSDGTISLRNANNNSWYLCNNGNGEWGSRDFRFQQDVGGQERAKFRLCKQSDDFESFAAKKVSVQELTGNDNFLIYRKFMDEAGNEQLYALASDGTFVRVYDGGDSVYWRETDKNIYWNYLKDGTYYGIFSTDPQTGEKKYLNPMASTGVTITTDPSRLTLIGKDTGEYSTAIENWDQVSYDYAGFHVTLDGQGVPSLGTGTRVAGTSDEFLFAVASSMPGSTPVPVATVDSDSLGIKITMFDYGDAKHEYAAGDKLSGMTTTVGTGSDAYTPHEAHALVRPYLVSGLPSGNGGAMTGLFTTGGSQVTAYRENVNHLFLQSYYDENGMFRYRSEDNFAYLPFNPDGSNSGNRITSNDFIVYQQAATPYTTDTQPGHTYYYHGHFMPFNDIDTTQHVGRLMNQYGNDYDPGSHTVYGELPIGDGRTYEEIYGTTGIPNFYTGMKMEARFSQPKNGKLDNGDDMIFKFTGDDDMWVYIDDVLVLDVGGIHEPLSGTINFATGKVTNPAGSSLAGETTLYQIFQNVLTASGTPQSVKDKINAITWVDVNGDGTPDTFADYGNHTFSAFYMERGAGASNLDIQFNLNVVLTNQFTVTKELPEKIDDRFANQKFRFRATYEQNGQEVPLHAGIDGVCISVVYKDRVQLDENGDPVLVDGKTVPVPVPVDQNGYFELMAGETAIFMMANEEIKYNVREVGIDQYNLEEVTIEGGGTTRHVEINSEQAVIDENAAAAGMAAVTDRSSVLYTNYPKTQDLLITKHILGDKVPVNGKEPVFEFRVYLETTEGDTRHLVPYSYGPYYLVRIPEGQENNKAAWTYYTLTGEGNTPLAAAPGTVCSTTGRSGSINSIPEGYTIIIPDLTIGTSFYLEERRDNIPEGYRYIREELTPDTYDPSSLIAAGEDINSEAVIDRIIARDEDDYQEFDPNTVGQIKDGANAESHVYNASRTTVSVRKVWDPEPASGTSVTVELHRYAKITKGTISVTLRDDNATSAPIKDAEFVLYKDGELTDTIVTTDVNGTASVSGLEAGTYKLVQRSTPDGYSMAEYTTETGELIVSNNVTTPQRKHFELTNKALFTAAAVQLTLKDKYTGTPISNALFDLYKQGESEPIATGLKTTDGVLTYSPLPAGSYYFVQTFTPEDYILPDPSRIDFEVQELPGQVQTVQATATNEAIATATVYITLTRKDNADPISGADFAVYREDGTTASSVGVGRTNAEGTATIFLEGCYGELILRQTGTVAGLAVAADQTFTVAQGVQGQQIYLSVENEESTGNNTVAIFRGQGTNNGYGQCNNGDQNPCATKTGFKAGDKVRICITRKQDGHSMGYCTDYTVTNQTGAGTWVQIGEWTNDDFILEFTIPAGADGQTFNIGVISGWGKDDGTVRFLEEAANTAAAPQMFSMARPMAAPSLTATPAATAVNAAPPEAPEGYAEDSSFTPIPTTLDGTVDETETAAWFAAFASQEAVDDDGNPYYYYVVEKEPVPAGYRIESYSYDNGEPLAGSGTVTITNVKNKTGSLQITKAVTVDGHAVTDANRTFADGTYTFKVEKLSEDGTAVEADYGTVTITIENGVAASEVLHELPIGTYRVTENASDNGTALAGISGGTADVVNRTATIEVNEFATAEAPVQVTFTNDLTTIKLKVTKQWGESGHDTDEITFTLKQRAFVETDGNRNYIGDPVDYPGTYTHTITGNGTVTIEGLPVSGDRDGQRVFYEYYVEETVIEGFDTSYILNEDAAGDDAQDWLIINTPVSKVKETTEINVTKTWEGPEGADHSSDNITYKVTQTAIPTDYVPITIVQVNSDGTVYGTPHKFYAKREKDFVVYLYTKPGGEKHDFKLSKFRIEGSNEVQIGETVTKYFTTTWGRETIPASEVVQPLVVKFQMLAGQSWADKSDNNRWVIGFGNNNAYGSLEQLIAVSTGSGSPTASNSFIMSKNETARVNETGVATFGLIDSSISGWASRITDLPLYDFVGQGSEGQGYIYSYAVEEIKVNGEPVIENQTDIYNVTYTVTGNTTDIKNTAKNDLIKIDVKKQWLDSDGNIVTGDLEPKATVSFKLIQTIKYTPVGTAPAKDDSVRFITDGANEDGCYTISKGPDDKWTYQFTNLPTSGKLKEGDHLYDVSYCYSVVEMTINNASGTTEDPSDRYTVSYTITGTTFNEQGELLTGAGTITINNQSIAMYELPSAGGPGTRLFTILGSILILGAGILLWRRRRLI